MKKLLLSAVFALSAVTVSAQLAPDSTAPDFTVTDINGGSHSLYSDYLNQGKVVLLNISAVWCGPCWNYHNTHQLAEFYEAYGPSGSDEAMVLYVEGDSSTPESALWGVGTGTITHGDWTEGTPYPIIDAASVANQYQITYFPTLYRICTDGTTNNIDQLTATGLRNTFNNSCETLVGVPNHVKILPGSIYSCDTEGGTASFQIKNYGNNNLSEAVVVFKENGTVVATTTFSGDIAQFGSAFVEFDNLTLDAEANYTVELQSVNGGEVHNEDLAVAEAEIFLVEHEVEHVTLEVRVYTDNYPVEAGWFIKDSAGNIIAGENSYVGYGGGADALTTKTHWIEVDVNECYTIELTDTYGDGWTYYPSDVTVPGLEVFENGNSLIRLYADVQFSDDNPLVRPSAIKTGSVLSTGNFETNMFAIYPNPSNGIINITTSEAVDIDVIDVTGKTVHQHKSLEDNATIDLSSLPKGAYFIKVSGENTNTTEKLILN